jgi:hypothetical protein
MACESGARTHQSLTISAGWKRNRARWTLLQLDSKNLTEFSRKVADLNEHDNFLRLAQKSSPLLRADLLPSSERGIQLLETGTLTAHFWFKSIEKWTWLMRTSWGGTVQKFLKVEKIVNIEWSDIMKDYSRSPSTDESDTIQDDHKPISDTSETKLSISGDVTENNGRYTFWKGILMTHVINRGDERLVFQGNSSKLKKAMNTRI